MRSFHSLTLCAFYASTHGGWRWLHRRTADGRRRTTATGADVQRWGCAHADGSNRLCLHLSASGQAVYAAQAPTNFRTFAIVVALLLAAVRWLLLYIEAARFPPSILLPLFPQTWLFSVFCFLTTTCLYSILYHTSNCKASFKLLLPYLSTLIHLKRPSFCEFYTQR